METTDIVIAGSGPTGLMLASELRLAGIRVTLVDGLPARTGESRAGGIHARSMEILDQRGMLDRLLPQGRLMQAGHFGGLPLDFSDFDTDHPYMLAILQSVMERELEGRATELGVATQWDSPVTGFTQDDTGVEVAIGGSRPRTVRAAYLVGCDGGRSSVRKLAGIGFPGTDATATGMLADVELTDPPAAPFFGRRAAAGDYSAIQFEPGWYRLIVQRHDLVLPRGTELTFEDFRSHFIELAGTDFGMHSPRWVTHYGDSARHAEHYRAGRIFLAGDAAHIHYPAGGQGQNLGLQDAVNLGWKLAAAVHGTAPESLLDSYESERHPIAARVLHNTRAQTALMRPGAHSDALRDVMSDLIATDPVRHRLGLEITALDIAYDTKCDHPLAGRRIPDAALITTVRTRVYELLRRARPILLLLNGTEAPTGTQWADRMDIVTAETPATPWPVPAVGPVRTPAAILIRPDGYVAWATDEPGLPGLGEALSTWFGASV